MDVQTDERFLINLEGYLVDLVCNVESMDELNLVAEVLVSVQDAIRYLAQGPQILDPNTGAHSHSTSRSPCRTLGVLSHEWNANMDGGSTHRFRLNINDSVYQPNSLLHARETETSPLHCRF